MIMEQKAKRHQGLAALLALIGVALIVAGGAWYADSRSSSVEDDAYDVATALLELQCVQDGTGCAEAEARKVDRERPERLALAGVGVVLLVAGIGVGLSGSRERG